LFACAPHLSPLVHQPLTLSSSCSSLSAFHYVPSPQSHFNSAPPPPSSNTSASSYDSNAMLTESGLDHHDCTCISSSSILEPTFELEVESNHSAEDKVLLQRWEAEKIAVSTFVISTSNPCMWFLLPWLLLLPLALLLLLHRVIVQRPLIISLPDLYLPRLFIISICRRFEIRLNHETFVAVRNFFYIIIIQV
jgi:hypothetical protein